MWWLFLLIHAAFVAGSVDFDLLIFTQQWPNSACLSYEESGPNRVCIMPKLAASWTVHGIWPTKLHTVGPGFCNKSAKFEPDRLKPIVNDLKVMWPNLHSGAGESSLWKHEWLKHGTCASVLPQLNGEERYFGKGIDWFKSYNMTNILSKTGIVPSDSARYPVTSFHDAIFQELKTNPRIECAIEKYTKRPFLLELRICFDKSLNPADCDGTMVGRSPEAKLLTNCPEGVPISYPRSVPPLPVPPSRISRSHTAKDLSSYQLRRSFSSKTQRSPTIRGRGDSSRGSDFISIHDETDDEIT